MAAAAISGRSTRAPARAPHRARSPPLGIGSGSAGSGSALARARALARSGSGSSATIGSDSDGCSASAGCSAAGCSGSTGYRSRQARSRTGARSRAGSYGGSLAAGIPRHRPAAGWRTGAKGSASARLGIEGLGVRPLPLQGFDGWLVGRQRLEAIGVVGPARSWLLCPVLLQVALGPVRAVFRRVGGRSRGPAGRSAHPPHDSEPSAIPRDTVEPRMRGTCSRATNHPDGASPGCNGPPVTCGP